MEGNGLPLAGSGAPDAKQLCDRPHLESEHIALAQVPPSAVLQASTPTFPTLTKRGSLSPGLWPPSTGGRPKAVRGACRLGRRRCRPQVQPLPGSKGPHAQRKHLQAAGAAGQAALCGGNTTTGSIWEGPRQPPVQAVLRPCGTGGTGPSEVWFLGSKQMAGVAPLSTRTLSHMG